VNRKEKRHVSLRPRIREAGNINCTILMQGITKIGTLCSMNNPRIHVLHVLTTHISKKSTEGNMCIPPYKYFFMRA
jgi:hypothetical protein